MLILNPSIDLLYEDSKSKHSLSDTNALVAYSGKYTGRCPKDKRVVKNSASKNIWWDNVNIPINEQLFYFYYSEGMQYLMNNDEKVYMIDSYAGWDTKYQINVRTYCTDPYHALFMRNMLIPAKKRHNHIDLEIVNCSSLNLSLFDNKLNENKIEKDISLNDNLIGLDLDKGKVLIYGTQYAGEMKKSVLTYMMYLMPEKNMLTLHSSACEVDDTSIFFFGLSGTGKTTLSAHPGLKLIGDDEHVWTNEGIFNIEGGCYAKCINLSKEMEPEIFNSIKYGAVLENVILNEDKSVDYTDISITMNTRCSYPLNHLNNVKIPAVCNHPKNIILLTCDAFGLIPSVCKLTPKKAIYYFLLGYTCKMPGTEVGVQEPEMTFSTCFAKPFIIWKPERYGKMLLDKITEHDCNVWLLNTGWLKDKTRTPLKYTRSIVEKIKNNDLENINYKSYPYLGDLVPEKIDGIPDNILNPHLKWENEEDYFDNLKDLMNKFNVQFAKDHGKELLDELLKD